MWHEGADAYYIMFQKVQPASKPHDMLSCMRMPRLKMCLTCFAPLHAHSRQAPAAMTSSSGWSACASTAFRWALCCSTS